MLGVLTRAVAGVLREVGVGAASATVFGFGFCAAAIWKKPKVNEPLVFGPVGRIEKYFG